MQRKNLEPLKKDSSRASLSGMREHSGWYVRQSEWRHKKEQICENCTIISILQKISKLNKVKSKLSIKS